MRSLKYSLTLAGYGLSVCLYTSVFLGNVAKADSPQLSHTVTIGATSNYVFRGISLTDKKPAAQGAIDVSYGIFYTGVWASNTASEGPLGEGFGPAEIDFYGGIKPVWGPVTFDFGAIGYTYFWGKNSGTPGDDYTYYELKAGLSGEIWKGLIGSATYYIAPSQTNSPEVNTVEGSLTYALPQVGIFSPTYSSVLGYTDATNKIFSNDLNSTPWFALCEDQYTYWNTGLALTVDKFTMDFRYWGTNLDDPNDLGANRFIFSAKVVLP